MTNKETKVDSHNSGTDKNKDSDSQRKNKYTQELRDRAAKLELIEKQKKIKEENVQLTSVEKFKKIIAMKQEVDSRPLTAEYHPKRPLSKLKKRNKSSLGTFEKLKPSNAKKEALTFMIIAIITISSLFIFSYQGSSGSIIYSSDIPTINIEASSEITNVTQPGFIQISPISFEFMQSTWANRHLAANIRKRDSDGGYSFELFRRENLFQIRDDDDWLLLPPGRNLDSLRTKLAFDVYNMLKENDPNYMLPHSKLVEVSINDVYQGIYLLSERIDRQSMNLNQENLVNPDENDMIFKINNWDGDFFTVPNGINSPWEQLYPNTLNFSQIPINLTEFIHNTSEVNFFNEEYGIFSIFDKGEIIDNLLFGLLVGHEIIEGSSYYLINNQEFNPEFFFLPWDFGQSWGFTKYGSIPNDYWINEINDEITSVCWSKLYYRLLFPNIPSINDGFIAEIKNRWSYVRSNLWDSGNIITYFNNLYSQIRNTLFRSSYDNSFVENYENTIESWILTRFNLLDDIFNELDPIFYDNFEPPYRENEEIFGFSTPAARRQYFKSSLLFSREKIHEVNVVIQSNYFSDMISRKKDNNQVTDRRYMPVDISIDEYSLSNAGFRIRGNYNRLYPKDSFKFKFSETELYVGGNSRIYVPENEGRRFLGIRRLNLRAAPVDFSLMNEMGGYEIFKILGMPCPRVSWAKLYITETNENGDIVKNKAYKGLYLLTEDIDKTFLRFNFKNPEGNLYKTTDIRANLDDDFVVWNGTQVYDIKKLLSWQNDTRIYQLRTNKEQDDYSDLEKFIHYINNNWSNIWETTNLTLLAKYFAASNFQGNWDDYVFLPHNYFLYSDPNFGFVFIPWDIEQNFNMGFSSLYSYGSPFAPDFRIAPLLSGYKGWFDNISWNFGIDPYTRPLWDNLINDSGFVNPYNNSLKKIADKMDSLRLQVSQWFSFIRSTALTPFEFTDPDPDPLVEWWYVNEIPISWMIIDVNRILNFLEGRAQFVLSQIP
jgi:spore coat protein CotH